MKFIIEVRDETYDWMAQRNGGMVSPEKQMEQAIEMNLRSFMMQDPPQSIQPAILQITNLCRPIVTSEPSEEA